MSKTIDEKVVEMRFDNKHFESNVQTTMSTLDKLKAKLNLTGASKGLENVSTAAKKVNMDGLVSGLNTVHSKFSALEVIGVGALLNIGNAAANAGKRLVASLSGIQAAMAGFNEYSMTMNTVQTLVNSTGKSVKEVEGHLKELDEYADKTVYSTADMFNNIYKFTNAGIDLDTAKTAMIGIANATAYAGQGAQQASIAYYNLAQSMSMGYLTTIDYKSLNLANIATKEFKERMADAAVAAGTLKQVGDDLYSTGKKEYSLQALFTEGLKDQWATTNVMMDVFKQYGSQETEIGKAAWAAAQEVKTFGMMMESLQAQAGTGWKETWQILFGDLDEAKRMWTGLANFIGNIIDGVSRWRNTFLDIAMNNPLKELFDKINNSSAVKTFQEITDKVSQTTKTLEEYQNMVTKIWKGDYKNQPYRKALVEQAGYNYEVTQSLVNLTDEIAGYGKGWTVISQITQEDVVAAEKKFGIYAEQTTDTINEQKKVIEELTEERLKAAGLSDDEIYAYRQLEKGAKKYGMTIDELAKKMDEASGRDLLYGSADGKITGVFQNIGRTITNIFNAIKKGWTDVFEGITGVDLYMIIERLNKFTEAIRKAFDPNESGDRVRKLTETFRGLFSIIHIITTLVGSSFKMAFQILKGVLGAFNIDVLDFTSMIGNAIYAVDRWITQNNVIVESVKTLTKWIINAVVAIKEWVKHNEKIMAVINKIKDAFRGAGDSLKSWFEGLKETDNIPEYLFGGLINGIKQNAPKVFETIKMVAKNLIDVFKAMLGIHSPSTVFFEIGTNIWQGLVNGIKNGISFILGTLQSLGSTISNVLSSIDWGKVVAVGIGAGLIYTVKEITGLMNNLTKPLEGLSDLFSGLGSALSSLGAAAKNYTDSMKKKSIAKIILNVAIGLGILAAAVYFLSKIDTVKLWSSIGAITVLAVILGALVIAITKFASSLDSITASLKDIGKVSLIIVGIGIGILLISKALKTIAGIDEEKMTSAFWTLIKIITALGLFIIAINRFGGTFSESSGKAFTGIGKMIKKIALALLIMVAVIKLAGLIKPHDVEMATQVVLLFGGIVTALLIVSRLAKHADKAGKMIKKVSISLLILVAAVKLAGLLKRSEIDRAIGMMSGFAIFMGILIAVSHFAGKEAAKAGLMMIEISIALMLLVGVMKFIGLLKPEDIYKGISVLGAFTIFMSILIGISHFAGKEATKAGMMLLSVSAAMVVLAGVIFVLSKIDPEGLFRATAAVTVLGLMLATIVGLSRFAENAKGTIISITVCLVLLSIAIGILSLINPQRLSASATALAEVMLGLASIIAATKFIKIEKGMFKNMLMLVAITALLAVVVAALSHFTNPQGAIASATALGVLMVALSGSLFILSKVKGSWKDIGKNILLLTAMIIPLLAFTAALAALSLINPQNLLPNILAVSSLMLAMIGLLAILNIITKSFDEKEIVTGVLALTAMALPLLAFTGILYLMNYVDKATESVNALVKLATACTLLLIPLSVIGAIAASGVGAGFLVAGILALTAMAIPMVAFVGILALMSGIENASTNAELLTTLMDKMVECLVKLSLVAPLALMADYAIFGLIGAVTTIGVLAVAVGALMDKFPKLQEFLDKGLPVLEQIALGIGKIIGNVVAGFMNSVAEELPHTAEQLSKFMEKADGFITGAKDIPDNLSDKIGVLIDSILALTGANILDKIGSFLSGGESFSRLGTELSDFIGNAETFITTLSSVKPEVIEGAKNLADAVLAFTKGNFWDTLTNWIGGDKDLGEFGKKLAPLGTGLSDFVSNLGTFKPEQVDTVKSACEALKTISEVAGELPKHGGIAQAFTGDNDLGTFSGKLKNTGIAIRDFVLELTKDDVFNASKIDVVKSGCEVIKMIAEVAGEIPKHGGIAQAFSGDNDISSFANKLGNVAAGIRGFVWELQKDGVITDKSIDKIHAVSSILYAISSLGQINLGETSSKLEELGARLGSFGNKITEYVKGINTISLDDLQSSKDKIDKIIEIANTLATVSSEPIEQLGEKLKNFATDALKKFIDGLNDEKPKEDASNAMKALIDAIIKAMDEKDDDVKTGATNIIETATKALESGDHTDRASKAGLNILNGFINGMNDKDGRVWNKAYSIGRTAVNAINKATDEHSPSKETFKTGKFFDQGFINGIKSLEDKIYNETYGVGDKARLGLGRAINGVSNLISEGIDDEFTIRPVLDLSDVRSGAAAINGMFGVPSLGVSANLNAISSGMRSYRQNGGEDVISAIDRLGKNLGNTSGDTYNINGITYDNGTEIQEAVSTLVRAARIERRT